MLNHIDLMGRFTADPELRYAPSNIPVTTFTLAVERDRADGNGERQTDFIDCVAWRATAELIKKHFFKGSGAAVSGRLQTRNWKDKDGNKRKSTEVVVENVYFPLGSRNEAKPAGGIQDNGFREVSDEDGELPF